MSDEALIRLDDLEDGGSTRVGGDGRIDHGLMVLRRGEAVFVYANRCPHVGLPLDFKPGQFLDPDRTLIQCSNHGAQFQIEDGVCVFGPCMGRDLEAVPVEVRDGAVYRAD